MPIEIREVMNKSELNKFIYLAEKIHKDHKNWVHPIFSDEKRIFDKTRNAANRYCDSIYLLAWENGKPIGRITGIINKRLNEKNNTRIARFGFLEVPDRIDVTSALLGKIEEWAKEKGMEKIVGPMGWTEEDPEGFQIEGFDETPNLSVYQNLPFLLDHMAQLGYTKENDYFVYKVNIKDAITDLYKKVYQRVKRNPDLILLEFKNKKELSKYILPIFHLMNECFTDLYGYSPLDEKEMEELASRYLPVVSTKFVKAAINSKNEVIGFVIGIPNISPGIRKAKGRLTPWGIYHILRAQAKSRKLDVYIGAIRPDYRNKGVDVLMGFRMLETALESGFEILDSHHEMELNTQMRAEMERVGGQIYKKYRIYQKNL
ncbi:MAG TPA: hypothetical protein PLE74_12295 [Candidatus Cloacimonadota bacterium]|nr:hypothetical protein [Candidatus Cloacimonadota bacterium]